MVDLEESDSGVSFARRERRRRKEGKVYCVEICRKNKSG